MYMYICIYICIYIYIYIYIYMSFMGPEESAVGRSFHPPSKSLTRMELKTSLTHMEFPSAEQKPASYVYSKDCAALALRWFNIICHMISLYYVISTIIQTHTIILHVIAYHSHSTTIKVHHILTQFRHHFQHRLNFISATC